MIALRSFAKIRLLIALCLAVLIGCAPSFQAVAHDQVLLATAATERHMALGDPVHADHSHGHTHDDGDRKSVV